MAPDELRVFGVDALDVAVVDGLVSLEVRYAIRRLAKNPAFTLVASLSLALGIGVITAVFTVFYAVLLRALSVRDPGALVVVSARNSGAQYSMSHPAYTYLRDHTSVLEDVVSFRGIPVNVSTGATTKRVPGCSSPATISAYSASRWHVGSPFCPRTIRHPRPVALVASSPSLHINSGRGSSAGTERFWGARSA